VPWLWRSGKEAEGVERSCGGGQRGEGEGKAGRGPCEGIRGGVVLLFPGSSYARRVATLALAAANQRRKERGFLASSFGG
jgi:hypothetical protein